MTTNADHAARNQQIVMLVIGLTAAKALARNRILVVIGLAAMVLVARRGGAAARAAVRRWAAANRDAWRQS